MNEGRFSKRTIAMIAVGFLVVSFGWTVGLESMSQFGPAQPCHCQFHSTQITCTPASAS
jgi:hypothetical protein